MSKVRTGDAFGRALQDCLAFGTGNLFVERDDGYLDAENPTESYFRPYRKWPELEKKALRLVRGRVLDIGTGGGRIALYLQKRGFPVTSIDQSPGAVRVCRKQGLGHVLLRDLAEVDSSLGRFDTALMFGNNFGILGSPRRLPRLLDRIGRVLAPGGRIIANSANPYLTRNPLHLAYHRWNRRRGRLAGQVRIRVRYQDLATPWFDLLLVSPPEMRGLLAQAGWKVSRLIEPNRTGYFAVIERR